MNPDQTINLNQNAADCIKHTLRFGETVYTNICNGNVSHVAWGGVDWTLAILIVGFLTAFLLFVLMVLFSVLVDRS